MSTYEKSVLGANFFLHKYEYLSFVSDLAKIQINNYI